MVMLCNRMLPKNRGHHTKSRYDFSMFFCFRLFIFFKNIQSQFSQKSPSPSPTSQFCRYGEKSSEKLLKDIENRFDRLKKQIKSLKEDVKKAQDCGRELNRHVMVNRTKTLLNKSYRLVAHSSSSFSSTSRKCVCSIQNSGFYFIFCVLLLPVCEMPILKVKGPAV